MRSLLLACLALIAVSSTAQSVKVYTPPKKSSPPSPTPRQPYSSMARDTTPFNCERYRSHPHPGMVGFCQGIENMTLRNEARRQGRPAPSESIIRLPALGTAAAKELGYACVGGQAMRRLPNGWEQVSAGAADGSDVCRNELPGSSRPPSLQLMQD